MLPPSHGHLCFLIFHLRILYRYLNILRSASRIIHCRYKDKVLKTFFYQITDHWLTVAKRSVFLCSMSTRLELMILTQKKMLRDITKRLKWKTGFILPHVCTTILPSVHVYFIFACKLAHIEACSRIHNLQYIRSFLSMSVELNYSTALKRYTYLVSADIPSPSLPLL